MTTKFALAVIALLVLTVAPLRAQEPDGCAAPVIKTVATVGMIADVVQNIGGTCVEVIQMMGPGVDPHLYRASEGDVLDLLESDVVFYAGLHLESRLADIFHQMDAMNWKTTVAVSEAIPEDRLLIEPTFGQVDPHVWMDVSLWAIAAGRIRDQLVAMDAAHRHYYEANAADYLRQLDELDRYAQEQIQRVPAEQRVLITAHDAFNYFGRRYGIEVFAPQGITTATEAGVEDIRRTVALIVERHIPAVFVESSVPPDIVEAIIAGAEARGQQVTIGGQLFSDAMGTAGTPEGTYIGMIRHNVNTIVTALLGGSVED